MKTRIGAVQKICLAAMLLVLTVLGTRIPTLLFTIPSADFIRISIGPAFIVFSSILLGPIFGGVIGGASDLLGAIVFPTTLGSQGSINLLITLMYVVCGVLPYFVCRLTAKLRGKLKSFNFLYFAFAALFIFVVVFCLTTDKLYLFKAEPEPFEWPTKIVLLVLTAVLTVLMFVCLKIIEKRIYISGEQDLRYPTYNEITFIVFINEIVVALLLGSLIKSVYYGINFFFIFGVQSILFFIDIPLNTFFVSLLMKVLKRFNYVIGGK